MRGQSSSSGGDGGHLYGVRYDLVVDHASASELLGAYALHACDDEECQAVEAHLSGCADCTDDASRLKELAGWIGVSEAITPAENLRSLVLRRARSDP